MPLTLMDRILGNAALFVRRRCRHPLFTFVIDEKLDFTFTCALCGRRYDNYTPHLSRPFEWKGMEFKLDGRGGIIAPPFAPAKVQV